jgi:uncharacterized protein YqgC (DUF456 family)
MIETVIIIIGVLLSITGILGCIQPALPGPPLNYTALLLLLLIPEIELSSTLLLVTGILTIIVLVLDYILPIWGAKVYKVSSYGIWGSVMGMIIGLLFFPPFGLIIGTFIGAVFGEMISGKSNSDAMRAGIVTFIFSLIAIVLKLSLSFYLTYKFIAEVINYI